MAEAKGLTLPKETQEQRKQRVMRKRLLRQLECGSQQIQQMLQRPPAEYCGGKVVRSPQALMTVSALCFTDLVANGTGEW